MKILLSVDLRPSLPRRPGFVRHRLASLDPLDLNLYKQFYISSATQIFATGGGIWSSLDLVF